MLFACTMNAVRSPMAAAIFSHLTGKQVRVSSAGVRPGRTDPYMIAVMDEIGIDLSEHEPQPLEQVGDGVFDLIVTLSPEAHHHALEFTRIMPADVEYWPTLDATAFDDNVPREVLISRYRQVRDELFRKIKQRFGRDSGPTV